MENYVQPSVLRFKMNKKQTKKQTNKTTVATNIIFIPCQLVSAAYCCPWPYHFHFATDKGSRMLPKLSGKEIERIKIIFVTTVVVLLMLTSLSQHLHCHRFSHEIYFLFFRRHDTYLDLSILHLSYPGHQQQSKVH